MTPSRSDDPSIPDPPIPDSTGASAPKVDPEDLMLRAAPRPVTRINRRVLIALSGTGLLLILGATIFALDPPRLFDRSSPRVTCSQVAFSGGQSSIWFLFTTE